MGLNSLLEAELRPVIELRNKFAHGQWSYILTNDEEDVNSKQMASFVGENLMSLQFKRDILKHVAALITDLVTARSFERDFDKHYDLIELARLNLKNRNYASYVIHLKDRYTRGKSKANRINAGTAAA